MSDVELNRRIAELRGWTEVHILDHLVSGFPPDPPHIRRSIDYLDDWAACGPLLQELIDADWHVGLARSDDEQSDGKYAAFDDGDHYASANTLQRAICEAWLAWREAQP